MVFIYASILPPVTAHHESYMCYLQLQNPNNGRGCAAISLFLETAWGTLPFQFSPRGGTQPFQPLPTQLGLIGKVAISVFPETGGGGQVAISGFPGQQGRVCDELIDFEIIDSK